MLLKNAWLICTPSIMYKITPAGSLNSSQSARGADVMDQPSSLYGLIIPNIRGMVRVISYSLLVLSSR